MTLYYIMSGELKSPCENRPWLVCSCILEISREKLGKPEISHSTQRASRARFDPETSRNLLSLICQ